MLNWLFPKSPIDTWRQAWVEHRVRWLIETLGWNRIAGVRQIKPDDPFLTALAEQPQCDPTAVLAWVCGAMGINGDGLTIEVVHDEQLTDAAAHYDMLSKRRDKNPVIRVARGELNFPMRLVKILAHELSHHLLLGGDLIDPYVDDQEWTTDLVPVALGFGIVTANETLQERQQRDGQWYSWSLQNLGYLPAEVIGYALAILSHLRDEEDTSWNTYLRLDARSTMRQTLRYLRRRDACGIVIEASGMPRGMPVDDLHAELAHPLPHRRVLALWRIAGEQSEKGLKYADRLITLSNDWDSAVQRAALAAMLIFPTPPPGAEKAVLAGLKDSNSGVRSHAARLAAHWRIEPELVVDELGHMLESIDEDEVAEATFALRAYGKLSTKAFDALCAVLIRGINRCHANEVELAETILGAADDAFERACGFAIKRAPEHASAVRAALEAAQEQRRKNP